MIVGVSPCEFNGDGISCPGICLAACKSARLTSRFLDTAREAFPLVVLLVVICFTVFNGSFLDFTVLRAAGIDIYIYINKKYIYTLNFRYSKV